MFELVDKIMLECWVLLVKVAPYVLFGFLAAGLLKDFLPLKMVARHLGSKSASSVLNGLSTGAVHHGGETANSPLAALPAVLLLILIGRNFFPRPSGRACGVR